MKITFALALILTVMTNPQGYASTGNKISITEAPWNIVLRNGDTHSDCGAVLITAKWLLTSAHCASGVRTPARTHLTAWGKSDTKTLLTLLPSVKTIVIAPGHIDGGKNNLALIELETAILLPPRESDGQHPAPAPAIATLSPSLKMPLSGAKLFFSGFGTQNDLHAFTEKYSEKTRDAQNDLLTLNAENAVCAGDEGAGLAILGKDGPELVAIANESADCTRAGVKPSRFTRVAPFQRWIDEKTERYAISQPENSDYRDWSFAELAMRAHAMKADFEPYLCDGERENELLPALIHENSRGDSLHVLSNNTKQVLTYRDGVYTDEIGKTVSSFSDEFFSAVAETVAEIEATPSGRILLSRLEHSPYPLKIKKGGPQFSPENDEGVSFRGLDMSQALQYFTTLRRADYAILPLNHIGTGGYVMFPPGFTSDFIEDDDVKRPVTSTVVLAHEMYHAFDSIRGLLDRRWAYGNGYEGLELSEFRAVAFENQIRKETGLHYRKYYGNDPDPNGGVLDAQKRPIRFSSPCLFDIPL